MERTVRLAASARASDMIVDISVRHVPAFPDASESSLADLRDLSGARACRLYVPVAVAQSRLFSGSNSFAWQKNIDFVMRTSSPSATAVAAVCGDMKLQLRLMVTETKSLDMP